MKPYVKRNKNDAADAEAICEAATRPTMRFVEVKTEEQQSVPDAASDAATVRAPAYDLPDQCDPGAHGRVWHCCRLLAARRGEAACGSRRRVLMGESSRRTGMSGKRWRAQLRAGSSVQILEAGPADPRLAPLQ